MTQQVDVYDAVISEVSECHAVIAVPKGTGIRSADIEQLVWDARSDESLGGREKITDSTLTLSPAAPGTVWDCDLTDEVVAL